MPVPLDPPVIVSQLAPEEAVQVQALLEAVTLTVLPVAPEAGSEGSLVGESVKLQALTVRTAAGLEVTLPEDAVILLVPAPTPVATLPLIVATARLLEL